MKKGKNDGGNKRDRGRENGRREGGNWSDRKKGIKMKASERKVMVGRKEERKSKKNE